MYSWIDYLRFYIVLVSAGIGFGAAFGAAKHLYDWAFRDRPPGPPRYV